MGLSDRPGLLVAAVRPDSPAGRAGRAGLRAGDVLLRTADRPLVSCVDLAAATVEAVTAGRPLPLPLLVLRGEDERDLLVDTTPAPAQPA